MRRLVSRLAQLALAASLAAPAAAQLAQGAASRLMALSLDGAGGSMASLGVVAHVALGDLAGGELTSVNYRASFGFLAANDPQLTAAPIVFGLQPDHGPVEGGTLVTVSGMNFDNWGQGASVWAWVGGSPASDVSIDSPSVITLVAPAGVSGPNDLYVSSSLGETTREDAFLYTPAVTATPVVSPGGEIDLRNTGPPGDRFVTFVSLATQEASTRFGTLLVGPFYVQLTPPRRYPRPGGEASHLLRVPDDASLIGLTFHFQSMDITHEPPHTARLTNACSVSIL